MNPFHLMFYLKSNSAYGSVLNFVSISSYHIPAAGETGKDYALAEAGDSRKR